MTAAVCRSVDLSNPATVTSVSTWTWKGSADSAVVVLAHGAGSRGDHPVHVGVSSALAATGTSVVAFNFPYAEAGRRSPDRAERLLACYRDVCDAVGRWFPGRPVVAGGRSMGGRMASLLAADGFDVAGLALLNYPLVAARGGPSDAPRTDHWPDIDVPVLFVHGTRDRLLPPEVFAASRHLLTVPIRVHVIDEADHVFAVPKRANRTSADVYAEVAGVIARWSAELTVNA